MKKSKKRKKRIFNGFTLIELLVVISIISLLASIALASMTLVREKARLATALETANQFRIALFQYVQDHGNDLPMPAAVTGASSFFERSACLTKPSSGVCKYVGSDVDFSPDVYAALKPYIEFPTNSVNPSRFNTDGPLYTCNQIESGKCIQAQILYFADTWEQCKNACRQGPLTVPDPVKVCIAIFGDTSTTLCGRTVSETPYVFDSTVGEPNF